jgi:hypothetical protein
MDGLAAEKALPFENTYRGSCSAMCNPRRSTPFFIENVVHELINTELHVKLGTRLVEKGGLLPGGLTRRRHGVSALLTGDKARTDPQVAYTAVKQKA